MRASVAQSTQPTPRHGVGLDELLCDHPQPGEARMSLGFIGADNREPVNTGWSEDGWRPRPVTEAKSAACPGRRLTGANGHIKREVSGANMELANAGFAWLRKSVMTDEVTAAVNLHNLLLDRA